MSSNSNVTIETPTDGDESRQKARETILMGYDTDALSTALQRLYILEAAYREELGHAPVWTVSCRLLLEDLLGRSEVYSHE